MAAFARFLHRLIGLTAVIAFTAMLIYASRFWIWTAPWGRDGLLGMKLFPPWGNTVQLWLRGTVFSEFSIIIWGCGAIIALSIVHWLASRFVR